MADKKLGCQDLKREFDNPAFRNKLKEYYPHRCSNCGSEENIEYHHVVPLKLGGTNAITNIIPLCHKCHKAAHCNRGRMPRTVIEEHSEIFDMYINGEIGNQKCKELLGWPQQSQVINHAEFKRYIASKGIKKVNNIVDKAGIIRTHGLQEGEDVGVIRYLDGRREVITYKDTGKNDIEYKRRANYRSLKNF